MDTSELIRIMQGSIAPVILISGVGLILLSMTNRLARPLDQIRKILLLLNSHSDVEVDYLHRELKILYKRCRILRSAIAMCVISIFFVSLVILMLFSTFLFELGIGLVIKICFALCIVSLISSLMLFLWDISLTLHGVRIEIREHYLRDQRN
ncbi:DUF2721 domain-containing protein [Maridesulfovibrio ferrireducens]|uniref:DUF2721 domain-containing protein n=1 Tax=Maridesulfovibrio ferrireducens TaxID=246191 RepID=UPI001A2DA94B|nr:DUF2721 domain-containing protein [Maridesulfovibrio ferrireducens]MBI9110638.1 DUF2721 domain-containing protein [Maridesulfovibrio ferrireducens]